MDQQTNMAIRAANVNNKRMEPRVTKIKLPTEPIGNPAVMSLCLTNEQNITGVLQESCCLRRLFCGNVHTSAQLPLPEKPRSSQALAAVIGCWICVRSLNGCSEVYGFIARPCTNWVLPFPLLRNVPASNLQLPTARVPHLLQSLSRCVRAPPVRPLQAARVEGSVEAPFVLWRVWIFESRWARGGVHDRFGPRRQRQGGEDAVIHRQQSWIYRWQQQDA